MTLPLQLAGRRFGQLIVLPEAPTNPRRRWLCHCDCGAEKRVAQRELIQGGAKSCGCLRKEQLADRNYKHGQANSPTYISWLSMRRRIAHPVEKDGPNYAGVTICERWAIFANFLEDMGERPPNTTLDRYPNMRGNYETDNCRWATTIEQANNKTDNVRYTFKGKTQTQAEWAKELGINQKILSDRIIKLGWDIERALSTPPRKLKRH
jgi:hypothetical protein